MKLDIDTQAVLNNCLKDQLTLINQTFLHARIAKDWGLESFNDHAYKASIRAMKAADKLIDRILFLEGLPNLQDLGKLMIGESIPEILECDLNSYLSIRSGLTESITKCEEGRDYVSRDELTGILEWIEEEVDWIETQQWLIKHTGLENYIQSQMGDH